MSDTGDAFNARHKIKQAKRASNRNASAQMLVDAGIEFETKNLDAHLIVQAGDEVIDFWPGTGLWIIRGSREKHRGVRFLIQHVKGKNGSPDSKVT